MKSGNVVRKSGKNRENSQQNRGKSELSHGQYWYYPLWCRWRSWGDHNNQCLQRKLDWRHFLIKKQNKIKTSMFRIVWLTHLYIRIHHKFVRFFTTIRITTHQPWLIDWSVSMIHSIHRYVAFISWEHVHTIYSR